jgi:hypothetical protein
LELAQELLLGSAKYGRERERESSNSQLSSQMMKNEFALCIVVQDEKILPEDPLVPKNAFKINTNNRHTAHGHIFLMTNNRGKIFFFSVQNITVR